MREKVRLQAFIKFLPGNTPSLWGKASEGKKMEKTEGEAF
jgi:hypothetical protein